MGCGIAIIHGHGIIGGKGGATNGSVSYSDGGGKICDVNVVGGVVHVGSDGGGIFIDNCVPCGFRGIRSGGGNPNGVICGIPSSIRDVGGDGGTTNGVIFGILNNVWDIGGDGSTTNGDVWIVDGIGGIHDGIRDGRSDGGPTDGVKDVLSICGIFTSGDDGVTCGGIKVSMGRSNNFPCCGIFDRQLPCILINDRIRRWMREPVGVDQREQFCPAQGLRLVPRGQGLFHILLKFCIHPLKLFIIAFAGSAIWSFADVRCPGFSSRASSSGLNFDRT